MSYIEITAVNGVRNDASPERFAPGDLTYAKNVDIDDSGRASRRAGTRTLIPGPTHSVWSNDVTGFMVQDDTLYTFDANGVKTPVAQVKGPRVSYVDIAGNVFWSDGHQVGIYGGGNLDVAGGAAHTVHGYKLDAVEGRVRTEEIEYLTPWFGHTDIPAGHLLGYFSGRLYVAKGNFLLYSAPFKYNSFTADTDFYTFDSPVQTFAAVDDGIFVSTRTQTYFLAGRDPRAVSLKAVLPYGGTLGTEQRLSTGETGKNEDDPEATGAVIWMSPRGPIIGKDGGVVKELTAKRFLPPRATSGAAFLRRFGGSVQYIASLFSER